MDSVLEKTEEKAHHLLSEPLVKFYKAYPDSLPVMSADRSALGTIPTHAYQYCEAITTASGFGWYAFPAATVTLYFDGSDIYRIEGDCMTRVISEQLTGMDDWWNNHCPQYLENKAPPFLTSLGIPGYLQIWSGQLVESRKNWSTLVRPLANVSTTNQYFCFEGIVESDRYCPSPLFINIKLKATHTPIVISASEPLFQIQPIHRDCYSKKNHLSAAHHSIGDQNERQGMSDQKWAGYAQTIRHVDPSMDSHKTGQYATSTRKRQKQSNNCHTQSE